MVRFGYGLGVERFERFRFSVPAVPLQKAFFFSVFQCSLTGKNSSGFGSSKTVPAVPVPLSVFGKSGSLRFLSQWLDSRESEIRVICANRPGAL